MTDRLSDVASRIDGMRQLRAVVGAMKGIAAARAHAARRQVEAVDRYAATISAAMGRVLAPQDTTEGGQAAPTNVGLLVFLAEQGFAGAFSARVLDGLGEVPARRGGLFVVGTRGLPVATAQGLMPAWSGAMPSHTPGIPKLADVICREVSAALDTGTIDGLDVVHASWASGRPTVARHTLFPLAPTAPSVDGAHPLTQLPAETLLADLGADYLHAAICKAALHAFSAENEARMEAMTSAESQIERELVVFEARLRRVRQEAITAEIIELGTGAVAAVRDKGQD